MSNEPKYFNPLSNGNNRNKPCICGSGKKIKKCHGVKKTVTFTELEEIRNLWKKTQEDFKAAITEELKEAGNE